MSMTNDLSIDDRREGFLVGAVVGAAMVGEGDPPVVATTTPPVGRRRAAVALSDALLEELVSGGVDLERLAGRWVDWLDEDGLDADPALFEALGHLKEFNAPISGSNLRGPAALAAVLPAALAASSPKSMLSGAFHTARMIDPDPDSSLSAAALVVALARLLEGSRDFIPDTLAMLRANNADEALFSRFLAIPVDPRTAPATPVGPSPSATDVAVWALWQLQHRRRSAEVLSAMAVRGELSSTTFSVLAAMFGARDGTRTWPDEWMTGAGEEVLLRRGLAGQLAADG